MNISALLNGLDVVGVWMSGKLLFVSLEVAAFAMVVWAVLRLLRFRSAKVREAFWLTVLLKPLVALLIAWPISFPFISGEGGMPEPTLASSAPLIEPEGETQEFNPYMGGEGNEWVIQSAPVSGVPVAPLIASEPSMVSTVDKIPRWRQLNWRRVIAILWFSGCGLMLGRLALGLRTLKKIRKNAQRAPESLQRLLSACAEELKIRSIVGLRLSKEISVPMLFGLLRPVIVFPRWCVDKFSDAELRLMLMHELAHWKYRDTWVLFAKQLIESIFFFHPAVWYAGRQAVKEAEATCDDLVVASSQQSRAYANCLMRVVEHAADTKRRVLVGLAAGGSITSARIKKLLQRSHTISTKITPWALIALLLVAMIGLPSVSCDTSKKDVSKYKEQAEKYERMGRLREAVKLYLNLAELSPEERGYCYATVSRLYREGPLEEYALYRENLTDIEQAFAYGKKAIAAAPDYPGGHKELAEAYEKLDMYEEAIPEWQKVIERAKASEYASEYEQAWYRLARAYYRTRKYERLEKHCLKALEVVKDRNMLRRILSYLFRQYRMTDRLSELQGRYENALQQNPTDRDALFTMSQLYAYQGERMKAIELYEKAIALKPDNVELYRDMVQLCQGMPVVINSDETKLVHNKELTARMKLYQLAPQEAGVGRMLRLLQNDRDASLAFLEQLAASEPKDADLYRLVGHAYARWKMYEEAIAAYQKALIIDKSQRWNYYYLARVYTEMGEKSKALEALAAYQKAFMIVRSQEDWIARLNAYESLASIYMKMGEEDKALEALAYLENPDMEGYSVFEGLQVNKVVRTYSVVKGKTQAANWLRNWVAVRFAQPDAHALAAEVYVDVLEMPDEAVVALQQAIKLSNAPYERYHYQSILASVYRRMGRFDEAKSIYKAMSQQPVHPSWQQRAEKRLHELERKAEAVRMEKFREQLFNPTAPTPKKRPLLQRRIESRLHKFEVKRQKKAGEVKPNPFGPEPWLPYKVKKFADVKIKFYDTSGKLVRTVDLGKKMPGEYSTKELAFQFDVRDDDGKKLPNGVYFYGVFENGEVTSMRKIVVMNYPFIQVIQERRDGMKEAFRMGEPPGVSNRGLMLYWQPGSQKNRGWNVYRSETATGQFVKVNNRLLPASDKPYYFVDVEHSLRAPKAQRYYRLEAIRTDGSSGGSWALVKIAGPTPNPFGPDWGIPITIAEGEDQLLGAHDAKGQLVWTMAICYRQGDTSEHSNKSHTFWLDGRTYQIPKNIAYFTIQCPGEIVRRIERPNKLMNYVEPSLKRDDYEKAIAETKEGGGSRMYKNEKFLQKPKI